MPRRPRQLPTTQRHTHTPPFDSPIGGRAGPCIRTAISSISVYCRDNTHKREQNTLPLGLHIPYIILPYSITYTHTLPRLRRDDNYSSIQRRYVVCGWNI